MTKSTKFLGIGIVATFGAFNLLVLQDDKVTSQDVAFEVKQTQTTLAAPKAPKPVIEVTPPPTPAPTHTVAPGETLIKISSMTLGTPDRFREISVYNELANPHVIMPGQVLKIPTEVIEVPDTPLPASPWEVAEHTKKQTVTKPTTKVGSRAKSQFTSQGKVASKSQTSAPSSNLESIAACESGGNPTAVSPSGKFRGKYQFDRGTYNGLGYEGDPAAAPESVQDQAAADLYSQRGSQPWPTCG